jgi:hypothetical protein
MMNWTGRLTDDEEMQRVRDQAAGLVRRLSPAGTIWVVAAGAGMGSEATAIFMTPARERFRCGEPMPLKGAFFDQVVRCLP